MRTCGTTVTETSERLVAHLRSLGASTPWLGVGRTFERVGETLVPALVVFVSEREMAVIGPLAEFEGFPLIWNVAYAAAA